MEADFEDVSLDEAAFAVVDVETTRLSPLLGDRVCEIALMGFGGGRELSRFHSLANPGRSVCPGAFAVHGIADEDLSCAPTFCRCHFDRTPVADGQRRSSPQRPLRPGVRR